MTHQFYKTSMRWILLVLVYVAITAGCAGLETQSKPEASSVTAISIFLEPDAALLSKVKALNASFLKVYPQGYTLDVSCPDRRKRRSAPHISLIHRYVRTADLDKVYAAAGQVLARANVTSFKLEAFEYYFIQDKELCLTSFNFHPTAEMIKLQADMIAAVTPFTVETGDSAAFFTTPDDPIIDPVLIHYVSVYVPKQTGEHFVPHLTGGIVPKTYLDKLLAEPFEKFTGSLAGAGVCQLGQFGSCEKQLKELELKR